MYGSAPLGFSKDHEWKPTDYFEDDIDRKERIAKLPRFEGFK